MWKACTLLSKEMAATMVRGLKAIADTINNIIISYQALHSTKNRGEVFVG
jgi:hypothetical protein